MEAYIDGCNFEGPWLGGRGGGGTPIRPLSRDLEVTLGDGHALVEEITSLHALEKGNRLVAQGYQEGSRTRGSQLRLTQSLPKPGTVIWTRWNTMSHGTVQKQNEV